MAVLHTLAFMGGTEITPTVDGQLLDDVLGHPGMYGLDREEWRITARTLQGWMPQELGMDREEYVADGPAFAGGRIVPVRAVAQVWLTLPGGDLPEVLAEEVVGLTSYDSVPLLSCECGSGVGCAHESVSVAFDRARVHWLHDGLDLCFDRVAYGRAIEHLLELLDESPRLISDDEWTAPMQTRVIHTP